MAIAGHRQAAPNASHRIASPHRGDNKLEVARASADKISDTRLEAAIGACCKTLRHKPLVGAPMSQRVQLGGG